MFDFIFYRYGCCSMRKRRKKKRSIYQFLANFIEVCYALLAQSAIRNYINCRNVHQHVSNMMLLECDIDTYAHASFAATQLTDWFESATPSIQQSISLLLSNRKLNG